MAGTSVLAVGVEPESRGVDWDCPRGDRVELKAV